MTAVLKKNSSFIISILFIGILLIACMQNDLFTSEQQLQSLIEQAGIFAPIVFIIIQVVQVVFPVFPGGVSCVIGVAVFGPLYGFIYNYIGVLIGSSINFLLAKRYGKSFILKIISEETYNKYEHWLYQGKKVEWMFGMAILFPCAPDDIICLLAGLTPMSFNKFLAIMVFGKPASLLGYSIGLPVVMNFISSLI